MSKKKQRNKKPEGEHGGRREGSGKPSWFRGKSASSDAPMYAGVRQSASVRLTPPGWKILDDAVERLSSAAVASEKLPVSQTVVMETLIRKHGRTLSLRDVEQAAAMKI